MNQDDHRAFTDDDQGQDVSEETDFGPDSLIQEISPADEQSVDILVERLQSNPEAYRDPVELRRMIVGAFRMTSTMWAGPQPSPETLAEYEQITPGVSDRLWDDFFTEGKHRRELEAREQAIQEERARAEINRQDRGLSLAPIVYVVAMIIAAYLALEGKTIVAIAFLAGPLIVLIIGMLSGGNHLVMGRLAGILGRTESGQDADEPPD